MSIFAFWSHYSQMFYSRLMHPLERITSNHTHWVRSKVYKISRCWKDLRAFFIRPYYASYPPLLPSWSCGRGEGKESQPIDQRKMGTNVSKIFWRFSPLRTAEIGTIALNGQLFERDLLAIFWINPASHWWKSLFVFSKLYLPNFPSL